jgi:hypothetical protein
MWLVPGIASRAATAFLYLAGLLSFPMWRLMWMG